METSAQISASTRPALGPGTLWRVFWRSLFIQAAFNPREMQALGFTYALYPALARFYPDADALDGAARRHLGCCFNCHPYAAAAILGGAIHHEEKVARGEESPDSVNAFKLSLMGPLAALGDGFFWLSLRPAVGALAALVGLLFGAWGLLTYLVSYNAVHLALRARFLFAGYRLGDQVVQVIAASRLPHFGHRLRRAAAACAAAVAAVGALRVPAGVPGGAWGWLLGAWGVFATSYVLLGRGISAQTLAYGAAVLALICGVVF